MKIAYMLINLVDQNLLELLNFGANINIDKKS